jgi:hypothetical protein
MSTLVFSYLGSSKNDHSISNRFSISSSVIFRSRCWRSRRLCHPPKLGRIEKATLGWFWSLDWLSAVSGIAKLLRRLAIIYTQAQADKIKTREAEKPGVKTKRNKHKSCFFLASFT